jgi:hypothetical protein
MVGEWAFFYRREAAPTARAQEAEIGRKENKSVEEWNG